MSSSQKKTSPVVTVGDEADATAGFTARVLLSLVVDITDLRETAERLHVQVSTLARAHGIDPDVKR